MLLSLDVKCAVHLIMTAIATSHKNLLNVLSTRSAHLTQGSLQNMAVLQITLTINLPIQILDQSLIRLLSVEVCFINAGIAGRVQLFIQNRCRKKFLHLVKLIYTFSNRASNVF